VWFVALKSRARACGCGAACPARALGRIEHWPSAPRLGALLSDGVWEVRSAAGLALRALGAPGELVLRRVAREGDGVARDVALQALDLAKAERAS
jgi:hypothetical protein